MFSCCSSANAKSPERERPAPAAPAVKPPAPPPAAPAPAPEAAKPTPPAPAAPVTKMVKIAIIYYSMYGHIKKLVEEAKAVLSATDGVEVTVLQCAEVLPPEVLEKMHAPPKADHPLVDAHNLPDYDAFVFAFPTRFGTPAGAFKAFIDSTGQLWQKGALMGKPYTCFTSSATLGSQETTILGAVINFTAHGMVFVPSGYVCPGTQFDVSEVHGGSSWGAGTLAAGDGSRQPSAKEIDHVKAQVAHFAGIAKKLAA